MENLILIGLGTYLDVSIVNTIAETVAPLLLIAWFLIIRKSK